MSLSLFFKCRTFLQPVLGGIWDLHGDLVISLFTRPFTKHQVCVDINRSPPPLSIDTHAPSLLPNVTLLAPSVLYFKVLQHQGLPTSMRSGKTRTYIPPFYGNSSMSRITSLLACRRLERTSPARTKKPSKAA